MSMDPSAPPPADKESAAQPLAPAPDRPPLGIIGGSTLLDGIEGVSDPFPVETERGVAHLRRGPGCIYLQRHGESAYRPPHRIPHHAHVLAFQALGVREVVGFASVGALAEEPAPGKVVIPDDYLSRHPPPTFAGDDYLHIVPELDAGLRTLLLEVARGAGVEEGVVDGGVYAETTGPRFETRAEIRSLARDATVVGMTAASEATLFQERGLRYAILAIVDNWANGVGKEPLTLESFRRRQKLNRGLAQRLIRELLRQSGGSGSP